MSDGDKSAAVDAADPAADDTVTPKDGATDPAAPETADEPPDDADDATEEPDDPTAHLDDVDDGCGCAEVWEHLSEQREG